MKHLPRAQARALALHYLLDLPIARIAEETGVAEGTVKSWLSRGRAGLAEMLRDEVEAAKLAPAQDVQKRGARRRRTQMVVAGIAVLAVVAGLGWWRTRGEAPPPAQPCPGRWGHGARAGLAHRRTPLGTVVAGHHRGVLSRPRPEPPPATASRSSRS